MRNTGIVALSLTIVSMLTVAMEPRISPGFAVPSSIQPASETLTAVPDSTIDGTTPDEVAFAYWALGRFARAGLDLPPIDIYFHAGSKACRGYQGLHSTDGTVHRIDVCSSGRTPVAEHAILHELGHAWASHNLTDSRRHDFVEFQGATAWTGASIHWEDRGSEQAAEILAWGLQETSRPPRCLPHNDIESLAAAFRQLTGTEPITETSPGASN
jgi:hypothetical protein